MASNSSHAGFYGPKCWVVSAIVGAILGLIIAKLAPAQMAVTDADHADHAEHAGESHGNTVIQIEPDGRKFVRTASGAVVPYTGPALHLETNSTPAHGPAGTAPTEPHPASFSLTNPQPDSTALPGSAGNQLPIPAADLGKVSEAPVSSHGPTPMVPIWLCVPFALLLLSIAVMPFISAPFWHKHYPDFAFLLGAAVLVYYLTAFGAYGRHEVLHVVLEYYSFIALVGGLFVASGGILVNIKAAGSARTNLLLLAVGAVIANLVGTTGASMLLIRPFMRINKGRLRPLHVVFFIFIVSNCGGCLTPIGDPPLYLGFLKGVPFTWTLTHLWPMWLTVNAVLLTIFFVYDSRIPKSTTGRVEAALAEGVTHAHGLIEGGRSMALLLGIVACVFVDPMLKTYAGFVGFPVGATLQIVLAITAYTVGSASIRDANGFSFEPVKEVGFLFIGIFLTMAPALGYLAVNSAKLGLETPSQFYFGTGILSGVLDNAPTYVSFLQAGMGVLHLPLNAQGIETFIRCTFDIVHPDGTFVEFQGQVLLEAISLAAVFFGAMTYIGNGPNFMVRSIVDGAEDGLGVKMPSFFAYTLYALLLLFPVLLLNWFLFIR